MQRSVRRLGVLLFTAAVVGCNSNNNPPTLPAFGPSTAPTTIATTVPTTTPTTIPSTPATVTPTVGPSLAPTVAPTVGPTLAPTVAPTTMPSAAALTVNPASVSFPNVPGSCPASYNTTDLFVAENGYTGAYTATSQNTAVATVAPRAGYNDQFLVSLTPGAPMTPTTVTVSDALGQHVIVKVNFNLICLG